MLPQKLLRQNSPAATRSDMTGSKEYQVIFVEGKATCRLYIKSTTEDNREFMKNGEGHVLVSETWSGFSEQLFGVIL
jgi:hypothetical protein